MHTHLAACRVPTYSVRVNHAHLSPQHLLEQLQAAGVEVQRSLFLPQDYLRLSSGLQTLLAEVGGWPKIYGEVGCRQGLQVWTEVCALAGCFCTTIPAPAFFEIETGD